MARATSEYVRKTGQLRAAQFDVADETALEALIDEDQFLPSAADEVHDRVGDSTYNSTSALTIRKLKNAESYLTLGKLFRALAASHSTEHDEPMPSEFRSKVDDINAVARDWEDKAEDVIAKLTTTHEGSSFIGAWVSGGVDEDEDTILGMDY